MLLEIANPRRMIFTVAAREGLAVGDTLVASSDAFSGELTAEVVALSEGQAALAVNNENGQLRDGVRATFKKVLAELAGVIAVPASAVQQDSLGEFIYLAEKGRARKMYVSVGASSEGRTVIAKGLGAGSALVASGFDCLADGKKLRVVNAEELAKAEAARKEREAARKEREAELPEQKPVEAKPAAAAVKPSFFKNRFRPGLNFGLFTINDKNMKEFYGSSSKAVPGVELAIHTVRNIDLWLAYKSYTISAATSYLEDTVDFKLAPLSIGLRYRFARKGMFEPFAGLGVNVYSYKETVGGDSALPDTKESATGFHVQAGSYIHTGLARFLLGEVFAKYNYVKKTLGFQLPDGTDKFDLGGVELGLGIVLTF
jgi:outer membrane protein W